MSTRAQRILKWLAGLAAGALIVAARLASLDSCRHEPRDEHERLQLVLADSLQVAQQAAWHELEAEHGFSRLSSTSWRFPQVSEPAEATGGEARLWMAVEAQRSRPGAFDTTSPGVILEWTHERRLVLSDAQADLPASLRADRPENVGWLLFTMRLAMVEQSEDGTPSARYERLNGRLIDLDGALIARGTADAVPLPGASVDADEGPQLLPRAQAARMALAMLTEARDAPLSAAPPLAPCACVLEDLPATFRDGPSSPLGDPRCEAGATDGCVESCNGGNAMSCIDLGNVFDRDDHEQARRYYRLGCLSGSPNACTNWGSLIERDFGGDPDALACARELFVRTCDARDHYGCGMLGKAMLRAGEVDAAQNTLVGSCAAVGGFACDILGRARRAGRFGEEAAEQADAAFREACATYGPACSELADDE